MRALPGKVWPIAGLLSAALVCASARDGHAAEPGAPPVKATTPRLARVNLEVSLEPGLPATASQDWHKILTDLKFDGVRIRSAMPNDKPEITSTGSAAAPSYKVVGRLAGGEVLTLPGGRFKTSDRAALSAWLAKLRTGGPNAMAGGPRIPFGLTKEQFSDVTKDLSQPVRFKTAGQSPREFVDKLAGALQFAVTADRAQAAALQTAAPINVELEGLSAGAAAAYVLDGAGLALAPRAAAGQPVGYVITSAESKEQRWPIGLPPKEPKTKLAPDLFETIEVELDDVELNRVLESISESTKLPILTDRRSLAKANIDLTKTRVTLSKKKLVYASILDRTLGPKFIEHELRVDDAGKPFLYIRSVRAAPPADPPPTKEKKR